MNDPYRSIVQVSRDYITLIDTSRRYVFVNKAYLRALGRKKDEVMGRSVEDVWGRARYEGAIEVPLRRCLEGEEVHFIDEFPFGDQMKYVEVRFFPYREEKDGPVTHALVISHDISRLGELETRLMAYEFRDPATGLFNRRSLEIVLDREIQKAEHETGTRPRALFVLSLENLSEIRHRHGSNIATHIIENSALRLRARLNDCDTVFRSESDELAILITSLNRADDAATLADSIIMDVQTPYPRGIHEIRPECRLGIAFFPRDADTAEKLVNRAESALGTARDLDLAYLFYDEDLQARSVEKLQLLGQLRRALYDDRFELHFQPIVDTAGRIHGAECLLRWRHPELGLLLPGKFLQLAVDNGLNIEMERQTIFNAARHLARWRDTGIYLSINLSASMFEDPSLIEYLETALNQAGGVPKERLKLEITESDGMSDADIAIRRMREISDRGFGIYIDDFGTGHSSLRYLKDLPASVLKIDKAFVEGIESSEDDRHFLGHIIGLIRDRQRYVIIEGVENAAQAAILADLEADALQGFHFSKPLDADSFERLLRSKTVLPPTGS